MKETFQALVTNNFEQIDSSWIESIMMGGALVFLNLLLMIVVAIYWTNPVMHQYISGKPLL